MEIILKCLHTMSDTISTYRTSALKSLRVNHNWAALEMLKESKKMYDAFIDQFYLYKTTSYIRYDQHRAGTRMGTRLYYGQGFKINKDRSSGIVLYKVDLKFASEDLPGTYEYDSNEDVFNQVLDGFVRIEKEYDNGNKYTWERFWTGSYSGKYFSYSGNMNDAFNQLKEDMDMHIDNLYSPIFEKEEKFLSKKYKSSMTKNSNQIINEINRIVGGVKI